ncbi:putative ribonuclease H-like domain-containing protein [Tanacetum coccineum]|uniref:Ribonuclease H-like domain-containing protein n=1 Tax=Tanacetum coccineum TaxID=301880 RepID=A0ABQ5BYM1_9ASTR
MESVSAPMVAAAKLPVLIPGEFKLWKMRIEQYFLMTDYALWEVIVNCDSPPPKRTVDGVEKTYPPTTTEEKLVRKNELKARAIEKRFGGNKESKKNQKTLLKQQYKNFNGSSSEGLDQTYDRLQKLIKWKTHTLIWRNKPDLETLSMDDLYNNLKIYETEVKGSSSSSQNSQNVAFMSSNSFGYTNQVHGSNSANTDSMSDVVIYSFFANQSNSPQLDNEDLQHIDADDLKEMDLKWQMAMLTMRARRFLNKTGRNISANGSETIRFNKSKVECYNCHKKGHFAKECRAPRENKNREPIKRNVTVETNEAKALVAQDGLGYDWSDQAEEGPTNFAFMAYTSSSSSSLDSETQLNVGAYKAGLESIEARLDVYKKNKVVFEEDIKILKLDVMLRDNARTELRKKFEKAKKEKDDLKLTLKNYENSSKNLSKLESVTSVPNVAISEAKSSESKPKTVSEPLIKDWISDSEDENETEYKYKQRKYSFAKVEFVKSNEHVKTPKESDKNVENNKQAKYPRKNSQSPRGLLLISWSCAFLCEREQRCACYVSKKPKAISAFNFHLCFFGFIIAIEFDWEVWDLQLGKHGVPPTKRLFKVAMLDPPPIIGPWGTSGDPGQPRLCHMEKLGLQWKVHYIGSKLPEKILIKSSRETRSPTVETLFLSWSS